MCEDSWNDDGYVWAEHKFKFGRSLLRNAEKMLI